MKKLRIKLFISLLMMIMLIVTACTEPSQGNNVSYSNYPNRPVNLIVGWAAGGLTDLTARTLGPAMEITLGQSMIVENRPGASSAIAIKYIQTSPADGYNIMLGSEQLGVNRVLDVDNLSFNDFNVIKVLAMGIPTVTVHKDAPWNSLEELIEYVQANPGKVKVGYAGPGASGHIAMTMLKDIGCEFNSVPYDGAGPTVTATLGKHVDVNFQSATEVIEYVRSGDLKILGIFTNEPLELLPDATPLGAVYPEVSKFLPWGPFYNVMVNKDTPQEIVDKIKDAVDKGIQDPKWKDFIKQKVVQEIYLEGDEARNFLSNWESVTSWILYDAGVATKSPQEFNIPRP